MPTVERPGTRTQGSVLGGLLLGIGLGGFIDGIVLHQILQWHHMISHQHSPGSLAGLEANTVADGLFHIAAWVCTLAGSCLVVAAWRHGRLAPTWSFHVGLLLTGWGAFNLVEGLINHHLLQLHHVRDDLGAPLGWDLGFLVLGAALVAVGWGMHRSGAARVRAPAAATATRH